MQAQHERPDAAPVLPPELVFRRMVPSEPLLELARAQDALCRALLAVDGDSQVVLEALPLPIGVMHRVRVTLHPHAACAEHRSAEHALRMAYTQLLRNATDPANAQGPCARSAA